MSTHLPKKIGKYDVVGPIGRGAMGGFLAAIDQHRYQRVAIKTLSDAYPHNADVRNIVRAGQLAARLHHPNIVKIYEVVVHEGIPYVVTEYLEGESLDTALNDCRNLSVHEKVNIVIQISHGLACAHRQGIPHHAIKPANILLCSDGRIKIFDFGIVGVLNLGLTRRVKIIGGPTYLAPEQLSGGPVDHRADIFSAGVILYQLISDRFPFEGDDAVSTIFKVVHESPPPLSTFLRDYPPGVELILLRAMAKSPEVRYNSADDFASDLERLLAQLKEDRINRRMRKLLSSLDQGESFEGQSALLPALDVADQKSSAIRPAGDVTRDIQQDEVGKPVVGLWMQAEKALADDQFEKARQHAEQALALNPEDADLQQLWDTIRVEAARTEKLRSALDIAQAAQLGGDLDAARKAAEEAMEVAPNSAEAMALHQLISREILERARQRQIESCLKDARQNLSAGRFNGAIEILRRAEELDPNAPGVQSLIQLAVSGQQQERRRTEIESLSHEIQCALNCDDYRTAIRKSDEGLLRYPQERTLVNLRMQAEVQLQLAERKRVIDAELAAARELFQAGRTQEVKERLESILLQLGSEPQLRSPLAALSARASSKPVEHLEFEAVTAEALSPLTSKDAVEILQDPVKEFNGGSEVIGEWCDAQSEPPDAVQTALHRADQEPELSQSKTIIQTALLKLPNDRQLLEKLTQVSHLDEIVSKTAGEARRLEEAGKYDPALAKWEMIRVLHPRHPDLNHAMQRIRNLQKRARGDSRQTWIDRIEKALRVSDYAEASAMVAKAFQEFPWDSDLMELRERTELGIRQRSKAEKLLVEAVRLLSKQQWKAGAKTLVRACQASPEDLLIRSQVVEGLTRASHDAMQSDRRAAEVILRELAQIQPNGAASVPQLDQQEERNVFPAGKVDIASPDSEMPNLESLKTETPGGAERNSASLISPLDQETFVPSDVFIDNLRFTVTAPGSLVCGAVSEIQFWVHAERLMGTVLEQACQVHRPDDIDTGKSKADSFLRRGARLSIRLKLSGGLTCVQSYRWIKWKGEIGNAGFAVSVPSELPWGDLVGLASIRLNGCQIAKLSFLLNIGSKMLAIRSIPCQTVMHRKAFASYDAVDRDEVLARVQDMGAVYKGMRVYVDAVTLRTVTYWEPGLHASIDGADVFYLFWCHHAMVSDWVNREWRWALRSKGLDFIDPVPLESSESAPPPVELSARDFNDPLASLLAVAGKDKHH